MSDEFREIQTSNPEVENMLDVFSNDVKKESYSNFSNGCKGNISYECVRKSLNQVSDALNGRSDYVLIGGIPTQMEVVRRKGDDSPLLMNYFGPRITDDLDILTKDSNGIENDIYDSGYDESELLKIDTIDEGLINYTEEIINAGNEKYYSAFEDSDNPLNAELRVPGDTDLMYTKVHNSDSRNKDGTRKDAKVIAESGMFDVEFSKLNEMLNGKPDAKDYLMKYDFWILKLIIYKLM